MNKMIIKSLVIFFVLILSAGSTLVLGAEEPKKGIAYGTIHIQGFSGPDSKGKLTFYALGSLLEESSLSYFDDAYLVTEEGYNGHFELKGTFSGGPNGVATFPNPSPYAADDPIKIQLINGKEFKVNKPGAWINLVVSDPSIFESEPIETEEYDPEAPLVDSGTRINHRNGQVEIACPPDLEAWDVLKEGRVIYTNCHIKTGEDSTVELSFSDMTTFKMRPESEVVITDPPKETKMQLLFGRMWVNIKKMVKDGTMEVHGSQAVAGIKGTTLVMEEKDGVSTLKVIEGIVNYTSKITSKSVDVSAGQTVSADKNGLGKLESFDIEKEMDSWESAGNIKPDAKSNAKTPLYVWIALAVCGAAVAVIFIIKRKK